MHIYRIKCFSIIDDSFWKILEWSFWKNWWCLKHKAVFVKIFTFQSDFKIFELFKILVALIIT